MFFLDISKAFEYILHHAIIKVCQYVGMPNQLYKTRIYNICYTRLKYKSGLSPSIDINIEVKQGGPMSPILFNTVIDNNT